ncbi:ketopantoate reductase family protein [Paenibacillus sp. GCM10012306]|uniref:ketopantoate reductase family protein n=1 Tax=Paenibacillus sp. GCM10012306 TaxID=3317342 RepID=UPI0036072CF6
MRIDIIGAGSLGLLLAGRLISAGNEVRLWCRGSQQVQELLRSGINISYEDEGTPIRITSDLFQAGLVTDFTETYRKEPGGCIVITVKQNVLHHDLPGILEPLRNERPSIVCFQNGVGHINLLQELLPESNIYTAVTTEGAKRKTLTEVIHAGKGEVWIGKVPLTASAGDSSTELQNDSEAIHLLETLSVAGFSAFLSNDMNTMIYRKLLINAVINPLTALWRIPNGELLATEERIQVMRELYDEAIAVYEACGIPYETDSWEIIVQVCRSTSANTSSMLADVLAGRATEIRWINGSLVEMGERSGLAVPLHRCMCRLVEGMIAEER